MNAIRSLINSKYTIKQAFYLSTGSNAPEGKCFCPFHDNTHTPAAKVYQKVMVCFGACNRSYDAYDFLSKFRPDIIEKEAGSKLLEAQEEEKKQVTYPSFKVSSTQELINKWKEYNAYNSE